ncbi:cytochrome c biogenesis protein ResB [bacterium]|nr:cytochrome c biogenesis protein ResB [candidate division CSSED10-310 bacterium]
MTSSRSNSLISFLRSTRLTILVLILLGILSIIGTIVIQRGTDEEMHIPEVYSPRTIRIFNAVGWFDIYHSPLYSGLMSLLALNLILCIWHRLPKDLHWHRVALQGPIPESMDRMRGTRSIELKRGSPGPVESVHDALRTLGYRVRTAGEGEIAAVRGFSGRIGFYIAHLGILIILLGGVISALMSVEGILWMAPGDQTRYFTSTNGQKKELGFTLLCENFTVEYYDGKAEGMPKEFRSDLVINPGTDLEFTVPLRVNHPLSFAGYRLYQASYSPIGARRVEFQIQIGNDDRRRISLEIPGQHETVLDSGGLLRIETVSFEPDFIRDESGKAGSRSHQLRNPAVQIRITEADQPPSTHWLFLKYPDFHGMNQDAGHSIRFTGLTPLFATGIEVARDPGASIIWIGSSILVAGLILTFLIFPHRIGIKIQPGTALLVSGAGMKQSGQLEPAIEAVVRQISAELRADIESMRRSEDG